MTRLGRFLLAHQRNAIIAALLCTLLPLIGLPGGFLVSLLVALVTLQKGPKSGFWVLVWVALPSVALLILHQVGGFDVLLGRAALVWGLACILREYRSWPLVLEVCVVLAFIGVIVVHLVVPDVTQWWAGHITQYIKDLSKDASWTLSAEEAKVVIARLSPIATGVLAFFITFGTFLQLLVARWWQSAIYRPGAMRSEFNSIRMGQTFAVLLVIVVIGALFKVSWIIDFMPMMLLPFMIAGLSLLHSMVERRKGLVIPLILVYIGLLFLPYILVILLSFAGYIDSWYDFRKRRV